MVIDSVLPLIFRHVRSSWCVSHDWWPHNGQIGHSDEKNVRFGSLCLLVHGLVHDPRLEDTSNIMRLTVRGHPSQLGNCAGHGTVPHAVFDMVVTIRIEKLGVANW